MAALPGMLRTAVMALSGASLRSLQAMFPSQAAATQGGIITSRNHADPSGWPRQALDAEGKSLVAAVATATASRHDLVSFRARDTGRLILGTAQELSRKPAVALSNGMAITQDGDVAVPNGNQGLSVGQKGDIIVDRGRRVRLTDYQPFSGGGWGSDSVPAHYRKVLPGALVSNSAHFLWTHWHELLPAMAATLP